MNNNSSSSNSGSSSSTSNEEMANYEKLGKIGEGTYGTVYYLIII
jgi:hypothetical protein